MERKLYLSVDEFETQVAIIEDSLLVEYFVERADQQRVQGSLYKGKVVSIIPGMEAAFVDIGLGRNAFLYVTDALGLGTGYDELVHTSLDDDGEEMEEEESSAPDFRHLPGVSIQDLMKEGQDILVQLTKEPIGTKGARISANISLPGRYLVLLPRSSHLGVSRKIARQEERERLRQLARKWVPERMGIIVRTVAQDVPEARLEADFKYLINQWSRIQKASNEGHAPMLAHRELSLPLRLARDVLNDEVTEFVVDRPELFEELREYVGSLQPELVPRLMLYEGPPPLFKATGIEVEINNLLHKKVWLNCGGYVVIEETEALVTIDVNTGKYVGRHNLEDTVFHTNLEAAAEIARQVRLRDMGGIIIIDFIDMRYANNRKLVMDRLEEALKKDRARNKIEESWSELGLLQMTRKRVRKSLSRLLTQPCPYCKREGIILSLPTMVIKVLRKAAELAEERAGKEIALHVHPEVAEAINTEYSGQLEHIQQRFHRRIRVVPNPQAHFEDIEEQPIAALRASGSEESGTL